MLECLNIGLGGLQNQLDRTKAIVFYLVSLIIIFEVLQSPNSKTFILSIYTYVKSNYKRGIWDKNMIFSLW